MNDTQDNKWDKLLHIKTMGRDDSQSDQYRYPYEPTPYSVLQRLANTGLIRKNNILLDYGCGKGRVDFFLSYQTRCRCLGVEYDERIYEKVMENGMQKKVTEPYLVDALSFTEAEARIIEEMTPFISGEFTVSDIKRANYSELFPSDEESADRWFKCKLIFITLDEKSGAEKKTSTQVLVQAADLRDAVKKLDEGMKGTMADYQIGMVSETPLMDVYPYSAEPNDKPEFDPAKS
mgnify:FL=1